MTSEDAKVVDEFKNIVIERCKGILISLPAFIPQSNEDKIIFEEGGIAIQELLYNLEHSENLRECDEYLFVDKIASDYDMESIRNLRSKIVNNATNQLRNLYNVVDDMNMGETE